MCWAYVSSTSHYLIVPIAIAQAECRDTLFSGAAASGFVRVWNALRSSARPCCAQTFIPLLASFI